MLRLEKPYFLDRKSIFDKLTHFPIFEFLINFKVFKVLIYLDKIAINTQNFNVISLIIVTLHI